MSKDQEKLREQRIGWTQEDVDKMLEAWKKYKRPKDLPYPDGKVDVTKKQPEKKPA